MTFMYSSNCWFEIAEVPYYNFEESQKSNTNYINEKSARISQLFNNTYMYLFPISHRIVFDHGS